MKILRSKKGVTIEMAVLFMLITVGLSAVIFSYAVATGRATSSYRSAIESKFTADKIAGAFIGGNYKTESGAFDSAAYEADYGCAGQYSYVYYRDGEVESLDVYERSVLVECIELFLSDPIYCYNTTFDFDPISPLYVSFSMERTPDYTQTQDPEKPASIYTPSLGLYSGQTCIYKIYTERQYDEEGNLVYSENIPRLLQYKPSYVTWQKGVSVEKTDGSGNTIQAIEYEWAEPIEYSAEAVRNFYATYAEAVVSLKISKNSEGKDVFLKYRYGLA